MDKLERLQNFLVFLENFRSSNNENKTKQVLCQKNVKDIDAKIVPIIVKYLNATQ